MPPSDPALGCWHLLCGAYRCFLCCSSRVCLHDDPGGGAAAGATIDAVTDSEIANASLVHFVADPGRQIRSRLGSRARFGGSGEVFLWGRERFSFFSRALIPV